MYGTMSTSWAEAIVVIFREVRNLSSRPISSLFAAGSKFAVGSSRNMSYGSRARTAAMAAFFFSPTLSLYGSLCSYPARPTSKMARKGVSRFGVSVPRQLLEEFDGRIARMGYDRSKAIQLAMRDFMTEYVWKYEERGLAIGTMTIIYDHEVRGLEETLTSTQHAHRDVTSSALHIHLDERNCLLVIVLRGEVRAIREAAGKLMGKRGIKQLKLTIAILERQGAGKRVN